MSFNLMDTMASMSTHVSVMEKEPAPQAPRRRQRRGEEPFTFLAKALDRFRAAALELPPDKRGSVELEARLGIFCRGNDDARAFGSSPGDGAIELRDGDQVRFFSGVTSGAFEHMKASVAGLGTKATHLHEVVYGYHDKQRIRCDGDSKVGFLECKVKVAQVDVALPAAPYDLRLTLAVETAMQDNTPVQDGWDWRRSKLRTSYTDTHGNATLGPWSVDFTAVDSEGAETAEVELELSAKACSDWLKTPEPDPTTSRLASRLWDAIARINPPERSSPDNVLTPADRPAYVEAARQLCSAVLQAAGGGGRDKFPGTMPVSMCRKDIPVVQRGSYWLAEKTDGVRYLLASAQTSSGPMALLVERSMAVYTFPGGDALAKALPLGSVLDGELVFNRLTNTYIFLVFDLLFWGPDPCLTAPFSQRLAHIHLHVIPAYEARVADGSIPQKHLRLVGKRFYNRIDIARLFDRIAEEEGHRVYRDPTCVTTYLHYLGHGEGGKRVQPESECLSRYYHKTDGIVFQPDAPYVCGTDLGFLKWKWLDTVTIDFGVQLRP